MDICIARNPRILVCWQTSPYIHFKDIDGRLLKKKFLSLTHTHIIHYSSNAYILRTEVGYLPRFGETVSCTNR